MHPRSTIYYWKCDRPAAFHGTAERTRDSDGIEGLLTEALRRAFPIGDIVVSPAGGQGNHLTFFARIDGIVRFVRVDDGPERDDYLEVESHLLETVRQLGISAPRVLAVDASRREVPFAWHAIEYVDAPDLNQLLKAGTLDLSTVAEKIGAAVARWQCVRPIGFGPFDPALLRSHPTGTSSDDPSAGLHGFHKSYADYFHLHLDRHLRFLVERGFLRREEADAMRRTIADHARLLDLPTSCLVHKDLALWNILGTPSELSAVIDWDDAVGGDPLDDLSLLGCFHDGPTLARAIVGYETIRPLPAESRRRFWLHLLRNMLFKAVIRVGAGYFDRGDNFFLIGTGVTGQSLREFTHERLRKAVAGLTDDLPMETV